ncbi:hypothetical protein [Carnobacterium maltaromaticum]|uniref:hypothetical protein n=1 Tax=Carnobacterium maltaromaticum TaxID=2751 RepID=UPI0010717F8F|nr:hypothetical protein [Carnobacterium maltaromaticum]TFJ69178.1 hypothetical protein CKN94_16550 [Carnobacterium maltaromaticum]TFJ75719.1 hypothetical protein CKN97_16540 [Carnobacterium maltaromaticum]
MMNKYELRAVINTNNSKEINDYFNKEFSILFDSIEKVYSKPFKSNNKIEELIKVTIIDYYKDGFTINKSREISFLPLEIRLYIYVEMVKTYPISLFITHVFDRLCITLKKMENVEIFNEAVKIFTGLQMITKEIMMKNPHLMLASTTTITKNFDKNLSFNMNKYFKNSNVLRNKGLEKAMLDLDNLYYKEFWYGIKAFSIRENINDIQVAIYGMKIFECYYERMFNFTEEFVSALEDYYLNYNKEKLNKLLQMHELDQIDLTFEITRIRYL